jgi:hypothetical protein
MYFDLRGGALGCGASQVSASQSMIVETNFTKIEKRIQNIEEVLEHGGA